MQGEQTTAAAVAAERRQPDARKDVQRRHRLLRLVGRSFKRYWEGVNVERLRAVYGTTDNRQIADKLVRLFSRHACLLGGVTGLMISIDEVIAFATGGEGGLGLPLNILIAVLVLSLETFTLLRFQLALVACLGRLYDAPIDPDAPDDILAILAYAAGGTAAHSASVAGMKISGKVAARVGKTFVQREAISTLRNVTERAGIRLLQLAFVKYAIPLVSIGVGMGANYVTTRSMGRIATRHLQEARPGRLSAGSAAM